ncbi:hypothetical protein TUM4644_37550 [Shewanella colwelliana]|nr:hypothetical protein TUM4644_37550 [Shewanella colwelliana]
MQRYSLNVESHKETEDIAIQRLSNANEIRLQSQEGWVVKPQIRMVDRDN